MKCDECKFECCVSNESYTEYYCELFGEDVPEEFATYEGCNLMYQEAKKLCELNDKCMGTYYDFMYSFYPLSYENLTKEQQAEIDRIEKEHDLAAKKYNNYYDVLLSRRKKKMTEKDLDEFEKEFGFKLLPTSFKKPLSEITKEEYRERIEYLYNAIINDDSNEEDDF